MGDEDRGIQQKASEIADESVAKSGEIVEGAQQILGGDVKEGLAKNSQGGRRYRHRRNRKGPRDRR